MWQFLPTYLPTTKTTDYKRSDSTNELRTVLGLVFYFPPVIDSIG